MSTVPTPEAGSPNRSLAGSVVVGVDGSEESALALDWAVAQARLQQRTLALAHAVGGTSIVEGLALDQAGIDHVQLLEDVLADGRALLDRTAAGVSAEHPDLVVRTVLCRSDPRQALLDLGEQAAVVVLGSRGRGPVRRLLLGSVSTAVAKHADCPVVVVRPTDPDHPRRGVLAGVDGTPGTRAGLEAAYRTASERHLPLTVLHAYWDAVSSDPAPHAVSLSAGPPGPEDDLRLLLAEAVAGLAEAHPDVVTTFVLARGLADQVLVRAAREAELVVLGHRHRNAVSSAVFGSVAPSVLEHADCTVMVVPEPGARR